MPTPVAVYDANVLYPAQLRDFLMWLGVRNVVRPHWSEQIQQEWMRNLAANRDDISWEDVNYTKDQMETALPGASIESYEPLIGTLQLPDEDDRHVLAAAIHVRADWIVTFNLTDFPEAALDPHGIEAIHPDDFAVMLYENRPLDLIKTVSALRRTLQNPPKTASDLLKSFEEGGLVQTAAILHDSSELL